MAIYDWFKRHFANSSTRSGYRILHQLEAVVNRLFDSGALVAVIAFTYAALAAVTFGLLVAGRYIVAMWHGLHPNLLAVVGGVSCWDVKWVLGPPTVFYLVGVAVVLWRAYRRDVVERTAAKRLPVSRKEWPT